jgi:glucose/arabinose dehydrogenase
MRLALSLAAALVCAAPASAARIVPFGSGFDQPIYVTSAPGDAKTVYVVEQPGRILAVRGGRRTVLLDIRAKVKSGGEQGLLSVAFHPKYASNHRYYVNYTDTNGDTRVVEYPGGRQLLFVDQPYENHNGGQLQFGPDGLLYVGMGDGGSGGDPHGNGQNLGTPLAKLLRIDPLKAGAKWFEAGYGLRNPWRFSFDRKTGDLWIGDVGQGAWEEVDFRSRKQLARRWNYGWSILEGRHPFKQGALNRNASYVGPVFEYSHSTGGCSITGGYVYRGKAVPASVGRYFFGDYCNGRVWSMKGGKARVEPFTVANISSFGEDAAGELYLVSLGGTIYKLAR